MLGKVSTEIWQSILPGRTVEQVVTAHLDQVAPPVPAVPTQSRVSSTAVAVDKTVDKGGKGGKARRAVTAETAGMAVIYSSHSSLKVKSPR